MGFIFTNSGKVSFKKRVLRFFYKALSKIAFSNKEQRFIVQNSTDYEYLISSNISSSEYINLIPGSGVDLSLYEQVNYETKKRFVLFPARMIRDKGVIEFVNAARILKKLGNDWEFLLAGSADYDNPGSVGVAVISNWEREGVVRWLNHCEEMPPLFLESSIVCLPSYREGMPKSLLEAAAAGCAVVTTDVIGCREAIVSGVTGELVPVRDSEALAAVLLKLMNNAELRESYGREGRLLAAKKYNLGKIVAKTDAIYEELFKLAEVIK
jgi:glycosyltransferase involved in cell wall biosynthesis